MKIIFKCPCGTAHAYDVDAKVLPVIRDHETIARLEIVLEEIPVEKAEQARTAGEAVLELGGDV